MLRKIRNAVPWRTTTVTDFYDFTESLPAEHVIEWTLTVERWENDPTQKNPFVPTTKSMSSHLEATYITPDSGIDSDHSTRRSIGPR